MKPLIAAMVAAVLAVPVGLAAQAGNASPPAQNPPATSTTPTGGTSTTVPTTVPQQDNANSEKSEKKPKAKKSSCLSPPADSGLPDYCKNPFWEPRDWTYINSLQGGRN